MNAQSKICTRCGTRFYFQSGEEWKRTCFSCWKAEKNGGASDEAAAYKRGFQNGYEAGIDDMKRAPGLGIEPEMLKRLRMLCHPDRHGNSRMATAASQWLNSVLQ